MTDWRPSGSVAAAERRARLLARVRTYFEQTGALCVDTPALGAATATDPHIASIPAGDGGWLHTSPEFCMKRLLAAGYPDIYAICRVFRGGESGPRHLAEFTMLEWYRLGFALSDIIADTLALFAQVLPEITVAEPEFLDYRDAFLHHAGLDPFETGAGQLAEAVGADARLRATLAGDVNAWLDLLLATAVVPRFATDRLTIVRHYPASQAALARLCPADARFADRFEVFAGDLELANGYVELTDPGEQAARMDGDLDARRRRGLPRVPRDERLLAALTAGLPACAGVALGIERLQMLADRTSDIRHVVAFNAEYPP